MNDFRKAFIIFLSTGAFSGYAPVMPGTFGSIIGIVLYVLLSLFSVPVYLLLTIALVFLSVWISSKAE